MSLADSILYLYLILVTIVVSIVLGYRFWSIWALLPGLSKNIFLGDCFGDRYSEVVQ